MSQPVNNNSPNKTVIKYIALYGLLYTFAYTLLTAVSSILRTFFGYATIPLIVAVFTALRYAKNNDRVLTKTEKIKLILGAFIITEAVNMFYTAEVIGNLRSIDHIDGDFFLRQLMQLIAISVVFGFDEFYYHLKKHY